MSHDWWRELKLEWEDPGDDLPPFKLKRMTVSFDIENVPFQTLLLLWGGYCDVGIADVAAKTAEMRNPERADISLFDWDLEYLRTIKVNGEPAPEKYALYWVCEHQRRGHG